MKIYPYVQILRELTGPAAHQKISSLLPRCLLTEGNSRWMSLRFVDPKQDLILLTSSPIHVQYTRLAERETKPNYNLLTDYRKDKTEVYDGRLNFVLGKKDKHIFEPAKLL